MAEMVSPNALYENPERFSGVIGLGASNSNPEYPRSVHKLMGNFYPDWNSRLSDSLKRYARLVNGRWMAIYSPVIGDCVPIDITEFIYPFDFRRKLKAVSYSTLMLRF